MIHIAIVEDDDGAQEQLAQCLLQYQQEYGVFFQLHYFKNGITFLSNTTTMFDIIFMDIEMPHLNGMETAARMRKLNSSSCLIFVTNMAQYAIKGYEVDAMYFLLKPVSYSKLAFKLQKAIAVAENRKKDEVIIKLKSGLARIPISSILYVEVLSHRIAYHTNQEIIETWASLKQVENQLKPYGFARCNASYLVNLRAVKKIEDDFVMVHGEKLTMSRGKKQAFIAALTSLLEENT